MTPEQEHALEVARRLIAAGVPVFAAAPAVDRDGRWDPSGGHNQCGYWLPKDWESTVATEHWLDPDGPLGARAYRPGYALGAVMGHRLDLLDVDPRNGGDDTRAGLVGAGLWPTVYAAATTPSGGTHDFVAPLRVGSRDAVRDGLDVKGGTPEGTGRGFAFIAPTVKASKVTGELVAYRWTLEPDPDVMPEPGDDTGAALAEMVSQAKGKRAEDATAPADRPDWSHGPIPDGKRYPFLRSHVGFMRDRGYHLDDARAVLRDRWGDCAQPPHARYPMPWEDAEGLLEDIWTRYAAGEAYAAVSSEDDPDAALEAQLAFRRAVHDEAHRLRVREAASRIVRQERASALVEPSLVRLDDFLAVEDEPEVYRVEGLWPVGGRVVLAAQYKSGKTTLRDNLVRALVDGETFLGHFTVHQPEGRVVVIDDELDARMLRRWMRDQGIVNTDRVTVLPLRGKVGTFDLLDDDCRGRWAKRLAEIGASVVILDCLRPVLDALGLSEDKDAGRFLVAFDALLAESGASEAVVTHHMGHTGERSRGDTRIRDWPDVEWQLLREKADEGAEQLAEARRYFKAYGRDVDVPEGLLDYDHDTRRLHLAGGTRKETASDKVQPDLLTYLTDNPGASGRAIELALRDEHRRETVRTAIRRAVVAGVIQTIDGPKRAVLHFLNPSSAPSAPEVRQRAESECASAPIGGARAHTPQSVLSAPRRTHTTCTVCGDPLDPVLVEAGETTHPTCTEEMP